METSFVADGTSTNGVRAFLSADEELAAYQSLALARVTQLRWLAEERPGPTAPSSQPDPVLHAHETRLLAAGAEVEARSRATAEGGLLTPLERMRRAFSLTPLDVEILVAAAAAERQVSYRRIYAALWPESNLQPEVDFFVRLLADHERPESMLRARFQADAPLVAGRVLELASPGHYLPDAPLLYRRVRLAERTLSFLDGLEVPMALEGARFVAAPRDGAALLLDHALVARVLHAAQLPAMLPVLHGLAGVGRKTLAESIAHTLKRPLLVVDLESMPLELVHFRPRLGDLLREAQLQGAVLLLEHAEIADELRREPLARELRRVLEAFPLPRLLSASRPPRWPNLLAIRQTVFEVAPPSAADQATLWRRLFPPALSLAEGLRVEDIVRRYSLVPGAIEEACAELANLDGVYARGGIVDEGALSGAVRARLQHRLGELAQPVAARARFEDLILPDDVNLRLREILSFAKHRERLLGELGFGAKLAYGRGLSALFSGPPGTGKTMAATLIAAELGLELYRIDLAQVVNKFVGETEKNLAKVFDEATHGQMVLLFDEADSLFAKRSEVKSAHDRYANLEVNYLLQRMESFDGVMILTTNAETAIDPAFRRRLRFRVRFPAPDEIERAALWRAAIPEQLPMASGIDFDALADRYALVGGSIKNAAVRAAAAALEVGGQVTQAILMQAAALEYEEMGFLTQAPPR
jgi:ATPase family associated with various cellular activities (AAA)